MVNLVRRKRSRSARFIAKTCAWLLILALLAVGARFAYLAWFPDIFVNNARTDLANGDLRNAALAAERAFQIRNSDVDAVRIVADIADQSGQPVALGWREKLVELLPGSLPDILACADTELRFGLPQPAKETLGKAANAQGDPRYWYLEASADARLGHIGEAEREAAAAARLDPADKDYQLLHASLQLKTQHIEVRDEARSALEALTHDPRLRLAAERLLIDDSLANSELHAAIKLGEIVVSESDSQFYDKLTYLAMLKRSRDPKFAAYLQALQTSAAAGSSDTGTLVAWMRTAGLNMQAFDWVKSLPRPIASSAEAGPFVALAYTDAASWQPLHDLIADASWGKLDWLRSAFLARAAEMLGNGVELQLASDKALADASTDPRAERALAEIQLDWGSRGDAERTLWDIAGKHGADPSRAWALDSLYTIYAQQRNLEQLAAVTGKLAELRPDNDAVQNNFVMFSLLTHSNLLTVFPLAEAIYKRHPSTREYVSTYAYSLLVRGKNSEAMNVIMALSEADRKSPSVAPYCGIILAANNQKELAKTYLDIVDESKLFPEEAILVDAARNQTR